jgi:hypothetical protein
MSARDDKGIITLHESLRREPPDYATPEALAAQTAAYLASGREIKQIPAGVTALAPVAFKNAATRKANDISYSKKDRIRMEDGL